MKCRRSFLVLTGLAGALVGLEVRAQDDGDLLPPFPGEGRKADAPLPGKVVPGRVDVRSQDGKRLETRRAVELAELFIRRQQGEVSGSVPAGQGLTGIPLRSPVPVPEGVVSPDAAGGRGPAEAEDAGPYTELLPLPGDESAGFEEDNILLPDPGAPSPRDGGPPGKRPAIPSSPSAVAREALAPAPAPEANDQAKKGPLFRVSGTDAFKLARERGYKFTPANGIGSRDGIHTGASQYPNVLTSEVHGTKLSQLRPPAAWSVTETSNTFFMFCDARYNAVPLAPGWRIRGIRLEGPNWRWVVCPRSGANTASFSIRLYAYKSQEADTAVRLSGLTLEGPEGAADWRAAFPSLTDKTTPGRPAGGGEKGPVKAPPAKKQGEPPLPE